MLSGMYEMTMPQAGNTMETGTVVRWLKAEGQTVKQGEVLLEVETDKATVEIESDRDGVLLKVLAEAGVTVPIRMPIALLGEAGEDVADAVRAAKEKLAQAGGEEAPAPPPQQAPAPPLPPDGAVTPVLMPQAGNTMEEGMVTKWLVQVGQDIKVGDLIFEAETDKANVQIESSDAGRLARIVVQEGETVPVKTPVAYLADNDADVDAYLAALPVATPGATPAPVAARSAPTTAVPVAAPRTGRVKASPAARKIAAQRGVDLAALPPGRGPGGRILSTDVPAGPIAPAAAAVTTAGGEVRRPMSSMRRAIAQNLLTSKQTIPHFYMQLMIDAGAMMGFYRTEKAKYPCTINDVVVLAVGRAMQEFAPLRMRLDGGDMVETPSSNIGIAVGVDDGLVVPVVLAVEAKTLRELAAETRRLVDGARNGKLENIGRGTFTITNLGMFGIESFSAIINPPESGILAVGAAREEVIVSGGTMRPGHVMTLTFSFDHRVVDGLWGARFVSRLKEILEWPAQLT